MAASRNLPALQIARRAAQSTISKKLASRFRVQVVSESNADFVITQHKIGLSLFEVTYNLTEGAFIEILAQLKALSESYERSVALFLVSQQEGLDIFQRLQRTYLARSPLLVPCTSPDRAVGAIFSTLRIADEPTTPPRAPPSSEEELEAVLQAVPFLSREDIRHLVLSFGSVSDFARNVHDQELNVLLGIDKAKDTREYLSVNRPLVM